jgi:hypothetical protein
MCVSIFTYAFFVSATMKSLKLLYFAILPTLTYGKGIYEPGVKYIRSFSLPILLQNKLECFPLSFFQPSLIFESQARALTQEEYLLMSGLIRKFLSSKNALAFFAATSLTKEKSFATLTPDGHHNFCKKETKCVPSKSNSVGSRCNSAVK